MARRRKKRVNLLVLLVLLGIMVCGLGAGVYWKWSGIERRLFPKDSAALEKRADAALEAGEYREAVGLYYEAAKYSKGVDRRNSLWMKRIRAQLTMAGQVKKISAPVRAKEYRRAVESLRALARTAPKFVDAQELLVDLYWQEVVRLKKAGAWQEFIKETTKLIRISPTPAQTYFRRGYAKAHLVNNKKDPVVDEALKDYRKAIELDGAVAGYWLELCRFLQAVERDPEAQKEFQRGIKDHPDLVELLVGYAVYLRKKNDSDGSLKWLNEAITRAPENPLGYIALAAFYRTDKRYDEALAVLEKALKADDSDFRVYAEMSAVYGLQRNKEGVVKTLRGGLDAIERRLKSQTKPADAVQNTRQRGEDMRLRKAQEQLYALLGVSLLDIVRTAGEDRAKVLQEAGQCLSELEKLSPDAPNTFRLAGLYAAATGQRDKAIASLEKAYEGYHLSQQRLDGKTAGVLVNLYLQTGKRGKAERIIDEILRRRENPSAWILKAILQMEYQRFDDARESLRKALALDPAHVEAKNLVLAMTAGRDGQGVPAALQPTTWAVKIVLNRAGQLRRERKADQAIALLEQLYAKAPDNHDILSRLFEAYMASGAKDKARALMDRAARDIPERAPVYAKLRELIDVDPKDRYAKEIQEIELKYKDPFQRAVAKSRLARATGHAKQYVQFLVEAAALKPDDPGVTWQLFDVRLAQGQLDEAAQLATTLAEANLDRCQGRFFAAQLARARGNLPKAVAELQEVLKIRKDFKEAHMLLGQCLVQEKKLDKAAEAFKTAWQIDPAYGMAVRGLALVAELQGKVSEHERYLMEVHKLLPNDDYVVMAYWRMRERNSEGTDTAEIIAGRQGLYDRNPSDVDNAQRLAALYEQTGNAAAAEKVYVQIFQSPKLSPRYRAGLLAGFRARQKRPGDVDAIYKSLLTSELPKDELARAYVDYGRLLMQHSIPLAAAAFRKAVQIDPEIPEGHLALGQLKGRQRKWDEGIVVLKEYLRLRPDDRQVQHMLIRFFMEAKRPDEALSRAESLIKQDRTDAKSWTIKGLVLMNRGEFSQAQEALTQAINANLSYPEAYRYRAQLYEIRGEFSRARQDLSRAVSLSDNPEIAAQLGTLHLRLDEEASAQREFQSILKTHPDFRPALMGMLEVHFRKKHWRQYDAMVVGMINKAPRDLGPRMALVRGLEARKDYRRTAQALGEVMELAPSNANVLQAYLTALLKANQNAAVVNASKKYAADPMLGPVAGAAAARAMVAMGQGAQAEELFKASLARVGVGTVGIIVGHIREAYGRGAAAKLAAWRSLQPTSWQLRISLGDLYNEAKQTAKAVDVYTEALKLASGRQLQAAIWTRIGTAYYSGDRMTQAEQAYLEAIKLQADSLEALNNLAYLYATKLRQPDKAIQYGRKAYDLAPNHPDVLDTYGWVLALQKKFPEAERILNRALRLAGPRTPYLYHLGWVYEQTKRTDQALAQYKQVLRTATSEADPEYRVKAERGVKRLEKK